MYKGDFKGKGPMKKFVDESNLIFSALNNPKVLMPKEYVGIQPTLKFNEDSVVLDFGDALIFTTNNITWNLTGTATFVSRSASVINGKLSISVVANK